jgi:protein ImuA
MSAAVREPEAIHPSIWRASQLAGRAGNVLPCGDAALARELPGGGWPTGALSEILLPQDGCAELRLLRAPLAALASRHVLLLRPPHRLQPAALAWWGLSTGNVTVVNAKRPADVLWATERALRSGTCGALLVWPGAVRIEALRRLQVAAQATDTLLVAFRPLDAARNTSPAPLRVALAPAKGGVDVTFVKRRGPQRDEPLFVPLAPHPALMRRHATLDRRPSAAPPARIVPAGMVGTAHA